MKIFARLLLPIALTCSGSNVLSAAERNTIYVSHPNQAYRAEIERQYSSDSNKIVANVINGHSRRAPVERSCSDGMKARTILLDGPFSIGGYDRMFSQPPEKSIVIRRFGQTPSSVPILKVRPFRELWKRAGGGIVLKKLPSLISGSKRSSRHHCPDRKTNLGAGTIFADRYGKHKTSPNLP